MLEYVNIYNKNIPKIVKTRLRIQIWLKMAKTRHRSLGV